MVSINKIPAIPFQYEFESPRDRELGIISKMRLLDGGYDWVYVAFSQTGDHIQKKNYTGE